MSFPAAEPPLLSDEKPGFDLNLQHGHKDLVQAVAFNAYGDRVATGSVDGKIRVFNRHKDGTWRHCDNWTAHGGEILELQWLPPTIYPNLVASLGIEGRFKIWAEDPSAPPGRRFGAGKSAGAGGGRAAFETRSGRPAPFRSFSLHHDDESRHTHLALLAADGRLTVYESEHAEDLAEWAAVDEFAVCPRPARGDEASFRARFAPGPAGYAAVRAGVPPDALALAVAAMAGARVYRSRDVAAASYGVAQARREFYLAAELAGHRGLVRDVAWAPGNIRGYDVVATACQDGFVRVFRVTTPFDGEDGRGWGAADLARAAPDRVAALVAVAAGEGALSVSGLSTSLAKTANGERSSGDQPGQVRHVAEEISKLDSHKTPVWRVDFDDDGQILGSVGDDGKLICYRQVPDGSWVKSSELAMMKARMMAP